MKTRNRAFNSYIVPAAISEYTDRRDNHARHCRREQRSLITAARLLFMTYILGALVCALPVGAEQAGERQAPVIAPPFPKHDNPVMTQPFLKHPPEIPCGVRSREGLTVRLGDCNLVGRIFCGPYPVGGDDAIYDQALFRNETRLSCGKGMLKIDTFRNPKYDVNNWRLTDKDKDRPVWEMTPTIAYRLEVRDKTDVCAPSSMMEGVVSFRFDNNEFEKNVTITEGPFLTQATSENPSQAVIAFVTDEPCVGSVYVWGPKKDSAVTGGKKNPAGDRIEKKRRDPAKADIFPKKPGKETTHHEIKIDITQPDIRDGHVYAVKCRACEKNVVRSRQYTFKTPPKRTMIGSQSHKSGAAKTELGSKKRSASEQHSQSNTKDDREESPLFKFAFVSDSREDYGGGERSYLGSNRTTMSRIAGDAYGKGAEFLITAGDLIEGYSTDTEDFRRQLKAWKQSVAAFWRTRPVFTCMGNHEVLSDNYDDCSNYGISLDKQPYATDSAEAVFAEEFYNPTNGPTAAADLPTYKENVYKFQYGPVLFIGFNNNYWWTTDHAARTYGGVPQGYLLKDQLDWIEQAVSDASTDDTVQHIILFAQEPVFPCDGHMKDAMWYHGDNSIRAHTFRDNNMQPAAKGIIDVRNAFWTTVAKSRDIIDPKTEKVIGKRPTKVAAVLTGDEHLYHRTLITSKTPVDTSGPLDKFRKQCIEARGKSDASVILEAHEAFRHPVWHVTVGTGGAPFYAIPEQKLWFAPVADDTNTGKATCASICDKETGHLKHDPTLIPPWTQYIDKILNEHGYALIAVYRNKIVLRFISAATGEVRDTVTLQNYVNGKRMKPTLSSVAPDKAR